MGTGKDILKSVKNGGDFGITVEKLEEQFDIDKRAIGRFLAEREDVEKVSNKFFKYVEKK